jgi:ABC-type nitrate/sulfonate/bicarbonate transport system substrate-binding protein
MKDNRLVTTKGAHKKSVMVRLLFVILIIVLGLSACGKTAESAPPADSGSSSGSSSDSSAASDADTASDAPKDEYELTDIRILVTPGVVQPLELAAALGYLEPLKLDVLGTANGGPELLQAMSTGNTDIGLAATNGVINIVAASNKSVVSIITNGGVDKNSVCALATVEGSPIKSAKDLIGKTVGMNTLGAYADAFVSNYLIQGGLTEDEIKQVTFVVIPITESEQVLRSGELDAATFSGPYLSKALETGGIDIVTTDLEVFGDFQTGYNVVTREFTEKNPNTTRKIVEAIAEALNYVNATPVEDVRKVLEEVINTRGLTGDSTASIPYWNGYGVANEGGVIDEADVQLWLDWAVKAGDVKEGELTAKDIFTNEFNPYAK